MDWQPIETAPKGGGAQMVTDPAWVEPPRVLLAFSDWPDDPQRNVALCYYDWYYAPDGNGYYEGCSGWVVAETGETTNLHFSTPATHWMPLPTPPKEQQMSDIPEDVMAAAYEALNDSEESGGDVYPIARAIMAERERCLAAIAGAQRWRTPVYDDIGMQEDSDGEWITLSDAESAIRGIDVPQD